MPADIASFRLTELPDSTLEDLSRVKHYNESPYGTLCHKLPDQEWVSAFAKPANGIVPHIATYYVSTNEALPIADELDAADSPKVHAALDLLCCTQSWFVFYYLSWVFGDTVSPAIPGSAALLEEKGLAHVFGRALNHIYDINFAGKDYQEGSPPYIGKNNQGHPWYKMAWGSESALSAIRGVLTQEEEPPQSFVFPLNWVDAMSLEIQGAARLLQLPSFGREKLRSISDTIAYIILVGDAAVAGTDSAANKASAIAAAVGGLLALTGALLPALLGFGLLAVIQWGADRIDDIWSTLRSALELLQEALESAADNDALLNDTLAQLIMAWAWLPQKLDGLGDLGDSFDEDDFATMLGIILEGAEFLWLQLQTESPTTFLGYELPDSYLAAFADEWASARKPLIQLDPALFDYMFDGYANTETSGGSATGEWDQYVVPIYLKRWLLKASPTLQFARTVELASVLLEQLLNQESGWLALSGLALGEGLLGQLTRAAMVERDLSSLSKIHGGVPLARLFRYLWRQILVDGFIYQAIADGYDETCLFEIFCWMRTEAQRQQLEDTLGPISLQSIGGTTLYLRDFGTGAFGALLTEATTVDAWWWTLSADQREAVGAMVESFDSSCYDDWFPVDGSEYYEVEADADDNPFHLTNWAELSAASDHIRHPFKVEFQHPVIEVPPYRGGYLAFDRSWWYNRAEYQVFERFIPAIGRSTIVYRGHS